MIAAKHRTAILKLVLSALFLAIGIVLPFLTGQIQVIGNMLLPMHIPVMLCGLICGWQYGAVVGAVLPILRSLLFTMPIFYPRALAMAVELATYGAVIGLCFRLFGAERRSSVYLALFVAMLAGRLTWGGAMLLLLGVTSEPFTVTAFLTGAFLNAIPGMLLQVILIPAVILALRRAELIPLKSESKTGLPHS